MNKYLLGFFAIAFAVLFVLAATAAGPDYQAGVKDSITINCTNPTTRTDGTPLNWATNGGHVDYDLGKDNDTAIISGTMGADINGGVLGCQPTTIDLRRLPTNQQYYLHVHAFDRTEQKSIASISYPFFRSAAPLTGVNLALNKPITTSSIESATYTGAKAVDGNTTTRWASVLPGKDPEWIRIDLGATYNVTRVVLTWQGAYAKAYAVQGSTDGVTWTTISSTDVGDGGTDDMVPISTNSARYVRIYGMVRGTTWGYSLWEVVVYGDPVTVGPTPCTVTEITACDAARNACLAVCNAN